MTPFEWLSIVAAFGMPLAAISIARGERAKDKWRDEMASRLLHLDDCLDEVKTQVLSSTVNKADLVAHEAVLRDVIDRHVAAIGQNTHGLHERMFRLENIALKGE